MAKQSFISSVATVSGQDYSTQISSMVVGTSVEELDTTAYGDTAKRREGGLKDGTVTINWKFDDDLTIKNTVSALLGTVIAVTFKSDSGAIAAGNAELQANVLVTAAPDWGGDVGTLDEVSTSWPLDTIVTYDIVP